MLRVTHALHSLPSFRSLDFMYCCSGKSTAVAAAIASLTQLTCLSLTGAWTRYQPDIVRPLRNLVRLTLDIPVRGKAEAQQLAAELPRLTYLCVQGYVDCRTAPYDGPVQRGSMPLPAGLQELQLSSEVEPRELLELQLPPGLTRLGLWKLRVAPPPPFVGREMGPGGEDDASEDGDSSDGGESSDGDGLLEDGGDSGDDGGGSVGSDGGWDGGAGWDEEDGASLDGDGASEDVGHGGGASVSGDGGSGGDGGWSEDDAASLDGDGGLDGGGGWGGEGGGSSDGDGASDSDGSGGGGNSDEVDALGMPWDGAADSNGAADSSGDASDGGASDCEASSGASDGGASDGGASDGGASDGGASDGGSSDGGSSDSASDGAADDGATDSAASDGAASSGASDGGASYGSSDGASDGVGSGSSSGSGSDSDGGDDSDQGEQAWEGQAGRGGHVGQGGGGGAAAPPSAASPCPGFDELLEAVGLLYGRFDGSKGLTLQYEWEPSPISWPTAGDGHVRLFAALWPLGLRRLELSRCVLEVGDVAALVEHLPELEVGLESRKCKDVRLEASIPYVRTVALWKWHHLGRCLGLQVKVGRFVTRRSLSTTVRCLRPMFLTAPLLDLCLARCVPLPSLSGRVDPHAYFAPPSPCCAPSPACSLPLPNPLPPPTLTSPASPRPHDLILNCNLPFASCGHAPLPFPTPLPSLALALQDLILDCQLHPGAVPLLARLPRLDRLALHLTLGHGTDTWCTPEGSTVAAALMPLLLYGPSRPRVHVYGDGSGRAYEEREEGQARQRLSAAMRRGVRWLQGTLRGMGRDPEGVMFIKM